MSNTLLTINMITREAVRLWVNTNSFLQHIDTQYDDQFAITGAKIGQSLRIRLPNDYTVRTGPVAQIQDTAETNTTLTLATQKGVDVSFNSVERTMSLDDYSKRILAPAVNNLVGAVAADIMNGVEGGVSNLVRPVVLGLAPVHQQGAVVQDAHEAGRVAARADVAAAFSVARGQAHQRRALDVQARGGIEPVGDLGAGQRRGFADQAAQLRLVLQDVGGEPVGEPLGERGGHGRGRWDDGGRFWPAPGERPEKGPLLRRSHGRGPNPPRGGGGDKRSLQRCNVAMQHIRTRFV